MTKQKINVLNLGLKTSGGQKYIIHIRKCCSFSDPPNSMMYITVCSTVILKWKAADETVIKSDNLY